MLNNKFAVLSSLLALASARSINSKGKEQAAPLSSVPHKQLKRQEACLTNLDNYSGASGRQPAMGPGVRQDPRREPGVAVHRREVDGERRVVGDGLRRE